MKTLAKHVVERLEERALCLVFENDVERCWPSNKITHAKRTEEIQSFAESQDWTAAVVEGGFGTRVIFLQGLEPA
jgi:muramoyltetrapeptide carboxypeptidase LdcA involved in peptidoglycan recycling